MSTPMYDVPEHFPIPVNKDGQGPAEPDEAVALVCWCPKSVNCPVIRPEAIEDEHTRVHDV